MIPLLGRTDPFPALERALRSPDGLLAAGADLSPGRLLDAYGRGIFPWFGPGEPILWWSPDPRMVLLPGELRVTRALHKVLRNRPWEVRFDTAFRQVMEACAAPRQGQPGTWIVPEMIEAYCHLHSLGWAHSVEAWIDGQLAGGLYGMAMGGVFFGESMFTRVRDASKVALVHLVRALEADGFGLIDCQMATAHLASLGARQIPRQEFARRLEELINSRKPVVPWIPACPPK